MSPQATDERVIPIEKFRGLNLREAKNAVGDKDLTDAINYDLGREGELIKRTGWKVHHDDALHGGIDFGANQVKILGFFQTDSYQQFIAVYYNGTQWVLCTSPDAQVWTQIQAFDGTIHHGVQYTDKFYMVRTGASPGVIQWDGVAASTIASSPEGTFCRVFKDRLFVINTLGVGVIASRIYFSKPFDFSSTGWPAVNYWGVSEGDGDRLIALMNVQDTLVVFKTGSMWILYVQGDQTLWILRSFNPEIGCIGKDTLVQYEGVLYFASARGVYQTDGNTVRSIGGDITPVFDHVVVSSTTVNRSSAFVWQDRYILSLETYPNAPTWASWAALTWGDLATTPWTGSGAIINYLVYHIRPQGWTRWTLAGGIQPHGFVAVFLRSTIRGVYAGDRQSNGKIYKFGDLVYQDGTMNYECIAETKEFDFGAPTELKRGKWIGVAQRGGGTHTFTHVVDGVNKNPISVTPTASQLEIKIKGPEYFRSWRVRASATHGDALSLFGFHLHMSRRRHMAASRG